MIRVSLPNNEVDGLDNTLETEVIIDPGKWVIIQDRHIAAQRVVGLVDLTWVEADALRKLLNERC